MGVANIQRVARDESVTSACKVQVNGEVQRNSGLSVEDGFR